MVASAAPETSAATESEEPSRPYIDPDTLTWTPVDTGGGLVIDLPISETQAERVEWVASYPFAPEEYGSSALAVDGEVVFLNLQQAPADVGRIREGWIAAYMDGDGLEENGSARSRLRQLCRTHLIELRVQVYSRRSALAQLEGLSCPHSLTVVGSSRRPSPSLEPLQQMRQLRYLGFQDLTPSPADVAVLRGLPNLRVIGIDARITSCHLESIRSELPDVIVRHVGVEAPCL